MAHSRVQWATYLVTAKQKVIRSACILVLLVALIDCVPKAAATATQMSSTRILLALPITTTVISFTFATVTRRPSQRKAAYAAGGARGTRTHRHGAAKAVAAQTSAKTRFAATTTWREGQESFGATLTEQSSCRKAFHTEEGTVEL